MPACTQRQLQSQQEETTCKLRLLHYPNRRKKEFLPAPATAQPMRDCYHSTNEKPLHSELPVSSNRLVYNNLLNLPLFFYEKVDLSFVGWTCLWFWHSLLVSDCNSLLFPNKPVFAGNLTGSFIFQVNMLFEYPSSHGLCNTRTSVP